MSRFNRITRIVGLCSAVGVCTAPAATVVWSGGGTNNNWTTSANWAGGAVPGSSDIARFNGNTNRDPTISSGSLSVGAIEFLSGVDAETIGGSGTLTISGVAGQGVTNSSGAAHVFSPRIALGSSQTWATSGSGSNLTFNNQIYLAGHTLTIDADGGTTVSMSTGSGDVISSSPGGGAIVKNGDGTLLFNSGSVANTFDGGFTLNAGIVSIRNNASLGTGTLTLAGGRLDTTNDKTLANALVVSGTATLAGASGIDFTLSSNSVSGSGTLTIDNTSDSGAMSVGFLGSGFNYAGSVALADAFSELRIRNSTGTQTYSGIISGEGIVRQNVAGGTSVLSGANTFSGGVVLDAGTLIVGHDSALGSGTLDLSGGRLEVDTSRTLANALKVTSASTIAASAGVNLTFSSSQITPTSGLLTLDNSSDSGVMAVVFTGGDFTYGTAITLADAFTELRSSNTSGTQVFSAAISGAGRIVHDSSGTLRLSGGNGGLTGGVTLSAGQIELGGNAALGTGTFRFEGGSIEAYGGARSSAAQIQLTGNATIAGGNNLTLTGGLAQSGGDRSLSITNTGVTTLSTNDLSLTDSAAARSLTLDVAEASGGVVISGAIQDGGAGSGALVKLGGGSLTLNGANTFSGGLTLNDGSIVVGNDGALGASNVNLAGGALEFTNDRSLSNAIVVSGDVVLRGNSYSDIRFTSNSISATGGSIAISNSDGSGATTIGFSGDGFDLSANASLGDFTEIRFLNTSGTQTYSGVISGTGTIRQNGAGGTVVLSGNNSFSSGVILDAGTLVAAHDGALGAGEINLSGGTLSADADRVFANDLTMTASSTIAAGAGIDFTFSSNSIGGNSGTLTLENTSGSGTMSAAFTGEFSFARTIALQSGTELRSGNTSGTQTFTASISGDGRFVRSGGGMTELNASNTFTGGVLLEGGALSIAQNNSLGSGTLELAGGTLQTNGTTRSVANSVELSDDSTIGGTGALSLTGGFMQRGGDHTLSITNAAETTISDGVVTLSEHNTSRALTIDVAGASGGLTIDSVVQDGSGSGGDSLIKAGAGMLTLTNSNTFSGGITVNEGVLLGSGTTNIGGFAAFGDYSSVVVPTTVITVNNGGTLAVNSSYLGGDGSFATTQLLNIELNGAGSNGLGALRATGGTNTWNGNVSLGSNATITNAAVTGDPNILYLGPWNGAAPTFLTLNNHTVTFNGTGDVYVNSAIGASGGDTGKVVIDAAASSAIVYFGGPRNYFTGDTEIKNGILESQVNPGNHPNTAILGNLVIGDGTGGAGTAVMRQYFNHQISDTSTVTIHSDGKLDLSLYGGKTEMIQKLVLNGGQVDSTNGLLVLAGVVSGNDVEVTANSTFAGNFDLNNVGGGNPARTINVSDGVTFTLDANLFGKDFIKNGNGTMVMGANNNANGYTGRTRVEGGILRLTNSGALGGTGGGSEAAGTSVSSGATLQLSGGTLAVPAESLILNGTGYNSLGALNNASGNNSWAGAIKLNTDSTIKTDAGSLLITGSITGTAATSATQTLTVGGAANTTISGPIYDGTGGGKLDVTKVDSGTLTLNGLNTFTGAVNVQAGTVAVTAHNVLGAHTNAVNVSSGATFQVSGGGSTISNTIGGLTGSGLVSIVAATDTLKINHATANTFDGRLSGSGLFEKSGAGTFTFSSTANTNAFDFDGTVQLTSGTLEFQGGGNLASTALSIGTLNLTGGTLLLTDAFINVGTLNITGDTILDFGTVGSSILNATNIYITAGKTLLIKNWSSEVDFLFATGEFRQNNSSGTIALWNAIGAQPENQVHFEGDEWSPDGSHTTWTNYDYDGYQNLQIRPIPEPSTYGLCFLASSIALLAWRRHRKNRR